MVNRIDADDIWVPTPAELAEREAAREADRKGRRQRRPAGKRGTMRISGTAMGTAPKGETKHER